MLLKNEKDYQNALQDFELERNDNKKIELYRAIEEYKKSKNKLNLDKIYFIKEMFVDNNANYCNEIINGLPSLQITDIDGYQYDILLFDNYFKANKYKTKYYNYMKKNYPSTFKEISYVSVFKASRIMTEEMFYKNKNYLNKKLISKYTKRGA